MHKTVESRRALGRALVIVGLGLSTAVSAQGMMGGGGRGGGYGPPAGARSGDCPYYSDDGPIMYAWGGGPMMGGWGPMMYGWGGGPGGYGMMNGWGGGPGGGYGMMYGWGGPGGGYGPNMQGGQWGPGYHWTPEQRQKLRQIHESVRKRELEIQKEMLEQRSRLQELEFDDKPDEKSLLELQKQMSESQRKLMELRFEAQKQFQSMMNDEQRAGRPGE